MWRISFGQLDQEFDSRVDESSSQSLASQSAGEANERGRSGENNTVDFDDDVTNTTVVTFDDDLTTDVTTELFADILNLGEDETEVTTDKRLRIIGDDPDFPYEPESFRFALNPGPDGLFWDENATYPAGWLDGQFGVGTVERGKYPSDGDPLIDDDAVVLVTNPGIEVGDSISIDVITGVNPEGENVVTTFTFTQRGRQEGVLDTETDTRLFADNEDIQQEILKEIRTGKTSEATQTTQAGGTDQTSASANFLEAVNSATQTEQGVETSSTELAGSLSTGGEDEDFENVGHRVKIKVYGSRISYVSLPGGFTPLVPLAGGTDAIGAPLQITEMELQIDGTGLGVEDPQSTTNPNGGAGTGGGGGGGE